MKKGDILLVGWGNTHNYGTNLQAIALYEVLNKKYNCDFFWDRNYYTVSLFCEKAWKKIKLILRRKKNNALIKNQQKIQNTLKCFQTFNCVEINSKSDLHMVQHKYSAFVVGSDQVWNPQHVEDTYMLDFVPKGKKKVAYASSIGVQKIEKKYQWKYRKFLTDFNYISMREEQGARCISSILNRDVDVVLDPTLLLTTEDWSFFARDFDKNLELPEHYLLAYFVGNTRSYWDIVSDISQEKNLPVVIIPMNQSDYRNKNAIFLDEAGPKEFVHAVENADFICTDSFHMCAFSINFNKQFFAFKRFSDMDNNGQNSRIDNLFSMFYLNRYYSEELRNYKIDYSKANSALFAERQRCLDKLYNALGE